MKSSLGLCLSLQNQLRYAMKRLAENVAMKRLAENVCKVVFLHRVNFSVRPVIFVSVW